MFEAEKKTVEPMTVAYLRLQGPYSQMTAALDTLYFGVGTRGYTQVGPPMAVYLTDPAQGEDTAVWEVWAPIADTGVELKPDSSGMGVKRLPETTVASTMHVGPYSALGPVYDALLGWVEENGHTIAGPPQEVYFSDPEQVRESEYRTEIRFPITAE